MVHGAGENVHVGEHACMMHAQMVGRRGGLGMRSHGPHGHCHSARMSRVGTVTEHTRMYRHHAAPLA